MPLPPDLASAIRQRLAGFLSASTPDPLDLRSIVAQFGVLPLILDMGGCVALRPDGEVVSFGWDEPHDLEVEDDTRLRNAALCQGAKKYPELAPLVPARPPDATDCTQCGGSGEFVVHGQKFDGVICRCGGLGWVPSEASNAPRRAAP